MAITRIQNNQITDSSSGNVYLGVNAAAKVQDYSITAGKIQNNLTYGSDLTITGNLTVQGNTTTIDTVNLTVEDPLILLAKEQTGSPTLDIGYIGKRGTSDNIAFVWDESQSKFVTVFTTSENTNTVITISSYASLKTLDMDVTGNIVVTGTSDFNANVTMGNITFDSGANINIGNNRIQNVATPVDGQDAANKDYVDGVASSGFDIEDDTANTTTVSGGDTLQLLGTSNQVSVLVTGNDQVTFALTPNVSVSGNVTGGNILTGGIISATGNITGNYFIGNGSQLTGIDATQIQNGTSNVSIPVANGNVEISVGSSVDMIVINSAGGDVTGYWSATGNVTGGNLITGGIASVSGTATVGNLDTGGSISATGNATAGNVLTGGVVSAGGNVTGANFLTAGLISATGNITGGNLISGNAVIGNINVSGDITVNSLTSNTYVSATGNVVGGNVLTGGLISAAGTITANLDISSNAAISATGNVTGGNLITSGLATVTGNVIGGNISTAGEVTATGNVTGGNVNATADVSATGNIFGNNITSYGFVSAAGNVEAPIVVTGTVTTSTGDLILDSAGGNLQWDGTGNIILNSQWINNLADPVQAFDAATKQYVDDAVSTGITIHTPVYLETPVALPAATYAQGGNTYTVTDTVAGNTVVFSTAANLQPNDQLWFTSSFSGIVANVAYFVVSAPNTSAAILSTTYDGAPVSNISNATGLTQAVRVNSGIGATLTATANGALSVDSVAVSANDRILVYNQATAYENGVYVVTQTGNISAPWILTRSSDTNTYGPKSTTQLDVGDYFYVQSGATGAGESYVMTAPVGPMIIGYNGITFTQFSASQVYTANTAAGIDLTGTVFSAKVDNDTTAFDGNGNIIVKAGANLVTPNIGAATGTSLSLTGNIVSGNVNTGIMSASGNVTGSNILTTGIVSATGNITGNYFFGNGSQLTGVAASSVDANNLIGNTLSANVIFSSLTTVGNLTSLSVVGTTTTGNLDTAGTVSATGNVTGGNVLTGGIISATGTATVGNVDTGGTVSATGNVTGGNVLTGGAVSATGTVTGGNFDTAGNVSATGNVTGGNVLTSGTVSASGNVDGANVNTGNVSATGNVAAVGFTGGNVSVTGNVYAANFIGNISGNIDAGGANTEVQFNDGDLLNGSSNFTFDKATNIMTVTGTIQGTTVSATGNVIAGNVTTVGLVSATGTVTGGNIETAGYASATGNVTAGNVLTGGLISATGNITGDNLKLTTGAIDGITSGIINVNAAQLDTDFAVNGNTTANVFYVDAGLGTTSFGNSGAITNAIASFNTTDSILLPRGNTAQRPAPATVGMFRFNTTSDALEVYNSGSGWTTVEQDFTVIVADSFTGNGVQTNFTLTQDSTTAGTIVSINGVVQIPTTAYSVSGNSLQFTEAPGPSDTIDARILTTSTTVASLSNASGNATVNCLDAADTVEIEGNLLPSANITYNLGSPTRMWKNGYFAGNTIYLGNLQLKQADATTFAVYTNDGVTQANIDVGSVDVSSIISGTTVIGIGAPNGNAYLAPAGSNALVAASTGVFVTGLLSATGNITGNYLFGNGSQLTGIDATSIQNGTANVRTFLNGNVTTSAGGTANVLVVTSTGASVAGTVSASGNITGNYLFGNGSQLTGIDATSIQSGTSNVRVVSSGGDVTVGVGGTGNVAVFSTAGLSVAGNITAGNLTVNSDTVITGNLTVNGTTTTINSNTVTTNDLVVNMANNAATAAAANGGGIAVGPAGAAYASLTYNSTANIWTLSNGANTPGILSATGNVTGGNILTGGLISATGNITGNYILGNGSQLTGIDATSIQSGTSNVRVVSSGGNVTAGIGGTGNVVVVYTGGVNVTGAISASGNITGGNIITGAGTGGNISGANVISANTLSIGSIINSNANGVGNIGNSTTYFNTVFAKATSAQYADLAEMYEADGPIEPGTVVAFGGTREVTACGEDGSRRVAGVVSTNPSYIMNAGLAGDNVVAVALTGRVPTKVTGTVRKGDLMVAAGSGRARAEANPAVGAVIGKALADFDGAEGTIEVVVGRL